jgi:hypothetical protein
MVAEGFSTVDITQMNFNRWEGNCGDRISDGNAGVGVSSGVDQDSLMLIEGGMDGINESSFMVGLEEGELDLQGLGFCFQGTIDIIECCRAVDTRFALAQEIEIGAVEDEDT